MAERRVNRWRAAAETLLFGPAPQPGSPVEKRAITGLPWITGDPMFAGRHVTQEQALTLVPVYAANRLLGDTIATLPLQAYRKIDLNTRQRMSNLPQLFQALEDDGHLTDWIHQCVTSLTLRGNAYGLVIARDGFGFPTQITWLRPGDVHCDDSDMMAPIWYWQGRRIPSEDMVHIPWFTVAGRVTGLSPIEAMQVACNTGLYAQNYGSDWFAAGGFPPGTFKNSAKVVDPEEASAIKRRLTAAIRTREPIVYGNDWDYNAVAVPPEQAQFLATMQFTVNQIASIYGIPSHMIGGGGMPGSSLTYSNVEQDMIQFVQLTLRPWLVKLERAFSAIMPAKQYVKFNADALVRADAKSRITLYHWSLVDGWRNRDEVRALEDLDPIPSGEGQEYMEPAMDQGNPPVPVPVPAPRSQGDEDEARIRANGHRRRIPGHLAPMLPDA
jgi:HK97 family phage portal protein